MCENIEFSCQGCASCCMSHGYVYLTTRDRVLLSTRLGMSVSDFTEKYCSKKMSEFHLKNPEDDCIFLRDARCSVYDDRPEQCRTWPYWPENFTNGRLKPNAGEYCRGLQEIRAQSNENIVSLEADSRGSR